MPALRFMLNGEWRSEERASPTMSVLDYLRTVARLTGTKEGCAEGDCGACTIAVACPDKDQHAYQAVNSCLMMVGQLDGLSVMTVEGLARGDGGLHPVQQALVDTDATQCGFCTPGFVMSMFAFHQAGERITETAVHEALAGNLCRCTGYRPIIEACRRLAGLPPFVQPLAKEDAERLAVSPDEPVGFTAPRSLGALASALAARPQAWLLGGGTDLGLLVSKERQSPTDVISTARVPELKNIAVTADALELGGAVTYSAALPHLDDLFPAFGALVRRIGSRQIRNLGTIAGNLATASPIGDTLPCLIALEARVVQRRTTGARHMSVEDFITGYRKTALAPGEFIETICIPRLAGRQRFFAYKLSKRFDQDISAVIAAFRIAISGGKVASLRAVYGGVAPTPARAKALEMVLTGHPWNSEALAAIDAALARDLSPIGDHRASASYRLDAAANLVRRLHADSSGDEPSVRLEAL